MPVRRVRIAIARERDNSATFLNKYVLKYCLGEFILFI